MFFKYLTASFFVQDIKRASVDDNLGIVWSIVEDFFVSLTTVPRQMCC